MNAPKPFGVLDPAGLIYTDPDGNFYQVRILAPAPSVDTSGNMFMDGLRPVSTDALAPLLAGATYPVVVLDTRYPGESLEVDGHDSALPGPLFSIDAPGAQPRELFYSTSPARAPQTAVSDPSKISEQVVYREPSLQAFDGILQTRDGALFRAGIHRGAPEGTFYQPVMVSVAPAHVRDTPPVYLVSTNPAQQVSDFAPASVTGDKVIVNEAGASSLDLTLPADKRKLLLVGAGVLALFWVLKP